MDIVKFRSIVISNPPITDNRFFVEITPPASLGTRYDREEIDTLNAYARNVNMGGRNLVTSEIKAGKHRQFVYGDQYNTTTLNIMLDENYIIKDFFDDWQESVIDTTHSTIKSFYRDYTSEITITHLNSKNEVARKILLERVYPSVVGDTNLSKDSTNQIAILPITLSYRRWSRIV